MKKAIIIRATGGELTNQLWNAASIYAYCLERGYELKNPVFFEYGSYFKTPAPNRLLKTLFFLPFANYTQRKSSFKRRLWRKIYELYARIIISLNHKSVVVSDNKENIPKYIPPTKDSAELSRAEKTADTVYFDGWLFRNPIGIEKYRQQIRKYFEPRDDIAEQIRLNIGNLRSKYENIMGVHIRQGDYKTWRGGAYFVPQDRVREILDEYLKNLNKDAAKTCFVICSDGPVDSSMFAGLNIFVSKGNAVHDLFLLASTDTIIGSNSTFGAFASYYGNVPFIVMQKGAIDWEYYKDKNKFFENKYSTFVHY